MKHTDSKNLLRKDSVPVRVTPKQQLGVAVVQFEKVDILARGTSHQHSFVAGAIPKYGFQGIITMYDMIVGDVSLVDCYDFYIAFAFIKDWLLFPALYL